MESFLCGGHSADVQVDVSQVSLYLKKVKSVTDEELSSFE